MKRENTAIRGGMKTYTLRSGHVVTSKDGEWPTQYANRTAAQKAAAKIGGTVVHPASARAFYVKPPIKPHVFTRQLVAADEAVPHPEG